MRLDDLVVIGILLGVLALDALRGAPGFSLPVALTAASTLGWLALNRRRAPATPAPSPPRPAVLLRVRDAADAIGAAVTAARGHGVPVLVVDDGSVDASATVAERAGAIVLRHPRPRGPGAALISGLRLAARLGHSHLVVPDDLDDPLDVDALLAAIRGAPLAVHVLDVPAEGPAGRLAEIALAAETGWRIPLGGGARAWPVGPTLALLRIGHPDALEPELLTRAAWAGLPLHAVPARSRRPCTSAPPDAGALVLTHALLVAERLAWPPRWFRRVRSPPARVAHPRARRLRLLWARVLRAFGGLPLPLPAEGGAHLVRAFDGARGAVLLTAAIGDPSRIPRPRGAAKLLHVLAIRSPGDPPDPPAPPGRRVLRVTPEEGYLALPALRALRAGEVVLVEADALVDERAVPVHLLGARRTWPAGPWLLAALAQVPVLVVATVRDGGAWRLVVAPPILCVFDESRPHDAQIAEWAQMAADRLDALARRYPTEHRLAEPTGEAPIADGPAPDVGAKNGRGGVAGGSPPRPKSIPPNPTADPNPGDGPATPARGRTRPLRA